MLSVKKKYSDNMSIISPFLLVRRLEGKKKGEILSFRTSNR